VRLRCRRFHFCVGPLYIAAFIHRHLSHPSPRPLPRHQSEPLALVNRLTTFGLSNAHTSVGQRLFPHSLLLLAAPRHPITHLSKFPTSGWSIHWQGPTSSALLATSPLQMPAATVTFSKLRSPNSPYTHGSGHTPCTAPVRPSTSQLKHPDTIPPPFFCMEKANSAGLLISTYISRDVCS
jgi:hypothetical protein